jgi:5-methylthioadenosine/S-adenosylhomocysteine deaminase
VLAFAALFPAVGTARSRASDPQLASPVGVFEIQYTSDPSGNSPLAGQIVTTGGVVTAITADGFTIADSIGAWHAVFVYTRRSGPAIGDSVRVTGTVQEYYGMTEINNVTDFHSLSSAHPVIPLTVAAAIAGREAHESVLLQIESVTVTQLRTYGEWEIDGALLVDDLNDYVYFPQLGDELEVLRGVLFYSFGEFKLEPRETSDIDGTPIPHYALGGDIVTMNAGRDVLLDHYVEILGDRIVAIHSTMPVDLAVVETGGLIFPGLIDAHNHASYNTLDVIPFGATFADRYEWQAAPLYSEFRDQYNGIRDHGGAGALTDFIHKLAELRALCAGTTTIQGVNCNGHEYDAFAHQGVGINNAERFPSRVLSSTFPLSQSASYWQARAGEYWDRFVVHLSEGVNAAALDEFSDWQALGMLDARTTIIHGIALGASQWSSLSSVGGHLVWSPRSNVTLYGATANIPGALAAGVGVALAPDWTESGSQDLLSEMKYAREISDSLWVGMLTAQILTEMVTRNAAEALGAGGRVGQVAVGYQADLMVVPGSPLAPYEALLAADAADVALTVVSGRPMYGDPALMGAFLFLSGTENIVVGGATKQLATRIVSHAIPDAGVPIAQLITALQDAYAQSYPPICCFLGIEPDSCSRAPVGHSDNYELVRGGSLVVDAPGVLRNDFDGDGDSLTAALVAGPSHGLLTLGSDGGFVYEHDGTMAVSDTFVYIAGDGSLASTPTTAAIAIGDPTAVGDTARRADRARLEIHPNPFNPTTTITYELPRGRHVELSVFDVAGRRVAVLVSAKNTLGPHSLIWNGRDEDGRLLPSGVYFMRLSGSRDILVEKAVLLK